MCISVNNRDLKENEVMNGNAHFMFGASVGVGTALVLSLNPTQATLLVSTCLLGSIFPDIDNPKSNAGQLTTPISTVIGKIAKAEGKYGSHHRGIFHDPFFYVVGLVLAFFFYKPLIGFFIGTFTHLFLDCFNPAGIRFLGTKYINFGKIPSASKTARNFTYVMSFLFLGACIVLSFLNIEWINITKEWLISNVF